MSEIEKPNSKNVDGRINNGGAREGAGRPAFVPTDAELKQAEALAGYGVPQEQIAQLIRDGIHIDTLRAHFVDAMQKGKAKANSRVGKTLFEKAIGGDTTAMIWWSKTQMRWAETQKHEITGAEGGALEVKTTLDVSGLSTAALAEIAALAGKGDKNRND